MVGPLTILKMLHCRSLRLSKTSKSAKKYIKQKMPIRIETSLDRHQTPDININEDKLNSELCRVCLRKGTIFIFGIKSTEDLAVALYTIGGIEVSIEDSYPKHLCHSCYALLQGAILFRKTAQQTEIKLKMSKEKLPEQETCDDFSIAIEDNEGQSETEEQQQKNHRFLTCKRCDLKFNSYQEYSDHKLSPEHENKKSICPICNNLYAPEYMKKHMIFHQKEASFVCDVCGKYFKRSENFTRHRLIHFYKLPFQCSLCPYKGRFSESLKMHMRSHTGEKPYQCEQCPRRFINKSNLNKHMLTHKGEHNFRCEICGRGFYTKRELELHFKVVHAGMKEHICPVCDKAFGYRKQMMKHQLKVHKREKLKSGRTPIYIQVERMKQQGHEIALEP